MEHVEVNLGKICNNRCRFCMTTESDRQVFAKLEDVKKEIREHASRGFVSLGFLGGEPTIYPGLPEAIRYARECGFMEVHVVSNGRKYKEREFLKDIIEAGATRFSVSIHSHSPEVEDYMTRIRGGFDEKIRGLENLLEFRESGRITTEISLNVVVTSRNYLELPKSLVFFRNMGFRQFRVNFMRPEGRALDNIRDLAVSFSEFGPVLERIASVRVASDFEVYLEGIPPCVAMKYNAGSMVGENRDHINLVVSYNDVDGEGRSVKERFKWKQRRTECKVKADFCTKCRAEGECEGVYREYAKRYGFGELEPLED